LNGSDRVVNSRIAVLRARIARGYRYFFVAVVAILTPLDTVDDILLIRGRLRRLASHAAPSPALELSLLLVTCGVLLATWFAAYRFFRTRNVISRLLALVVVLVASTAMAVLFFSDAAELGLM
jgi:hypothetical protein